MKKCKVNYNRTDIILKPHPLCPHQGEPLYIAWRGENRGRDKNRDTQVYSCLSKMFRSVIQILVIMSFVLPRNAFCAQLRLDFSQDNRTYIWNTSLDCGREVDQGLSWGFSSAINSMLIKRSVFSNNQDRWQDDGKINLNLNYALTSRLKIGALFSQNINSLEKRKVTSSEYGIITEYSISGVRLAQIIGGKDIDRRLKEGKRKDSGFNHRLEISHSPHIFSESVTHISLSQNNSHLSNIPLLERDLSVSFSRNSSGEDSLEFFYLESWSKKKFYSGVLTDSQINTQRKTQRMINLRSSTQVPFKVRVDFDFDFVSSRYKYFGEQDLGSPGLTDNFSDSQNFSLKIKRQFFKRLILASFYKYLETDEDYTGDQKDQKMKNGELGGNLGIRISEKDSLYLTTSIGVTSFYAPEVSARFNDRDILTLFAWGEYLHVFSPIFSLRLEGGFRNFHQVYISNRLSANNNHNQTYVLSPTLIWRPHPKLDLKQNYNIQANYIYYDYEKSIESTKNRLFRRGSSNTSISYRLFPRVSFIFGYIYRYEDYGQLIWKDQWVQKPSWERRTHTFSLSMQYMPAKSWAFSPEYIYEKRKSWDHFTDLVTLKKSRALGDKFSRNMISLSCKYFVDDRNYISLSGAHRVQKSTMGAEETSDFATVSVSRVF